MSPVESNNDHKKKKKHIEETEKVKTKKIKTEIVEENESLNNSNNIEGTLKKKEIKSKKSKELPTISIAVPGSILDNAQSPEFRTYLAGQIARAACIYKIDEIIVFDDIGEQTNVMIANKKTEGGSKTCKQLAVILQYLECPQYLRKVLFPLHNFLKYTGVLNPLDAPHHFRQDDNVPFREGVVSTLPPKKGKGCNVDVGLKKHVLVDQCIQPYVRVTVKLLPKDNDSKRQKGIVVSPNTPKSEAGIYWGYNVRCADSIKEVFTKCPYHGGYDLKIGTSDKGVDIDKCDHNQLNHYKHALICFGGVHGLEQALETDTNVELKNPADLFDFYLNTCPGQGSRTIRTEEAILITLAELRCKIKLK
ncbi:putative methyltransferase C9orf114 [Daktulosphaira vitifoliae]|uniref:putative methyltransferase C9orf114 n=1 Tax=Daktulosphaira vitifoliae TaxID=58002 RepID=UPI0021AA4BAB|nr:putative methyltransferase C9orf114 [Daktulosphaira vitifoliae]